MNARSLSLMLALLFVATISMAQTRKISHRSHSGSSETFAMLMGEDHVGEYGDIEEVLYTVDPFIARVRNHYEQIAKHGLQPRLEVKRSSMDSIPFKSNETDPPKGKSSVLKSPKEKQKGRHPEAFVPIIPAPDFLVKASPDPAPTVEATEGASRRSNLWLLVGLLACTVAPSIVVVSTLMQRSEAR